MIESADEFVRLRLGGDGADYQRIKRDEAPLEVWLEIARDYPDMRFWVAFNRTVPAEVLRLLGQDDDWRVRARIASRRDAPRDVLEILSSDTHDAVASSVAGNPETPDDALARLTGHHWGQVRDKAAQQLEVRTRE
ncbi:hypothetical protein [Kitasatospora sp. MBT66]|uniref:hypothetical protein n=1 Tax=Kitasatospora sp. MBT66 TaxID=1444769 RepID=UPI0011EA60E4|nr:hypothetical protein [Kitasatospora sp. MBT66]